MSYSFEDILLTCHMQALWETQKKNKNNENYSSVFINMHHNSGWKDLNVPIALLILFLLQHLWMGLCFLFILWILLDFWTKFFLQVTLYPLITWHWYHSTNYKLHNERFMVLNRLVLCFLIIWLPFFVKSLRTFAGFLNMGVVNQSINLLLNQCKWWEIRENGTVLYSPNN